MLTLHFSNSLNAVETPALFFQTFLRDTQFFKQNFFNCNGDAMLNSFPANL